MKACKLTQKLTTTAPEAANALPTLPVGSERSVKAKDGKRSYSLIKKADLPSRLQKCETMHYNTRSAFFI